MSDMADMALGECDLARGFSTYSGLTGCKHCGRYWFKWLKTPHGWRLHERTNKGAYAPHICKEFKEKPNE